MKRIKRIVLLFYIPFLFMNCNTKKNNVKASDKEEFSKTQEREKVKHNLNTDKISNNKDSFASIKLKNQVTIYDFTFYLPTELEEWYTKNHEKGEPSKKWIIGEFYDQPTLKSTKTGKLLAYFNPEINNFILQFASIDGAIKNELTEIGDWGYGLHINVIEVTDKFVKVPNTNFNKSAWLHFNKDTDHIKNVIFGHHSSYVQQLVSLPKISVTAIRTNEQVFIEEDVYYIERYLNGSFTIRKEIPEDMPCGEEIDPKTDKELLKRYRLKINNLIDKSGNYRIRIAYTKGC